METTEGNQTMNSIVKPPKKPLKERLADLHLSAVKWIFAAAAVKSIAEVLPVLLGHL
jgi:hypothetical protein